VKLGNTLGRIGAGFSTFGQSEVPGFFSQGGSSSDPSHPNFGASNDQTAQEALRRIQAAGQNGTYGEGSISQTVKEFKNLEDRLRSGSISQKDYTSAASALRSQIDPYAQQLLHGGHASASAANAAGANDLYTNYFRNADIYKAAQDSLGRDLTQNEFAALAPYFGSGTPKELEAGRAALAQIAENDKNSPQGLERRYQQNASQYGGQVGNVFQDLLKRGASQDEVNHFGKLLASGDVDEYTLRQFVQQLPEYQNAQDTKERQNLSTELQGYDQSFFDKAKEGVISRYAQAGIQNSPSLDFALTNLMGDIQKQRSAYLADLSRQDYSGNKGSARQDYLSQMDQMYGNQNYSRNRGDALSDALRQRSYDVSDYTTQRNDLLDALSRQQNPRRAGIGGSIGGLLGAGVGGLLGGVPGATAGYSVGQGAGGAFDYLNHR
jgi:hypothetical protein